MSTTGPRRSQRLGAQSQGEPTSLQADQIPMDTSAEQAQPAAAGNPFIHSRNLGKYGMTTISLANNQVSDFEQVSKNEVIKIIAPSQLKIQKKQKQFNADVYCDEYLAQEDADKVVALPFELANGTTTDSMVPALQTANLVTQRWSGYQVTPEHWQPLQLLQITKMYLLATAIFEVQGENVGTYIVNDLTILTTDQEGLRNAVAYPTVFDWLKVAILQTKFREKIGQMWAQHEKNAFIQGFASDWPSMMKSGKSTKKRQEVFQVDIRDLTEILQGSQEFTQSTQFYEARAWKMIDSTMKLSVSPKSVQFINKEDNKDNYFADECFIPSMQIAMYEDVARQKKLNSFNQTELQGMAMIRKNREKVLQDKVVTLFPELMSLKDIVARVGNYEGYQSQVQQGKRNAPILSREIFTRYQKMAAAEAEAVSKASTGEMYWVTPRAVFKYAGLLDKLLTISVAAPHIVLQALQRRESTVNTFLEWKFRQGIDLYSKRMFWKTVNTVFCDRIRPQGGKRSTLYVRDAAQSTYTMDNENVPDEDLIYGTKKRNTKVMNQLMDQSVFFKALYTKPEISEAILHWNLIQRNDLRFRMLTTMMLSELALTKTGDAYYLLRRILEPQSFIYSVAVGTKEQHNYDKNKRLWSKVQALSFEPATRNKAEREVTKLFTRMKQLKKHSNVLSSNVPVDGPGQNQTPSILGTPDSNLNIVRQMLWITCYQHFNMFQPKREVGMTRSNAINAGFWSSIEYDSQTPAEVIKQLVKSGVHERLFIVNSFQLVDDKAKVSSALYSDMNSNVMYTSQLINMYDQAYPSASAVTTIFCQIDRTPQSGDLALQTKYLKLIRWIIMFMELYETFSLHVSLYNTGKYKGISDTSYEHMCSFIYGYSMEMMKAIDAEMLLSGDIQGTLKLAWTPGIPTYLQPQKQNSSVYGFFASMMTVTASTIREARTSANPKVSFKQHDFFTYVDGKVHEQITKVMTIRGQIGIKAPTNFPNTDQMTDTELYSDLTQGLIRAIGDKSNTTTTRDFMRLIVAFIEASTTFSAIHAKIKSWRTSGDALMLKDTTQIRIAEFLTSVMNNTDFKTSQDLYTGDAMRLRPQGVAGVLGKRTMDTVNNEGQEVFGRRVVKPKGILRLRQPNQGVPQIASMFGGGAQVDGFGPAAEQAEQDDIGSDEDQ